MRAPQPTQHILEQGRISTGQFAWMLLTIITAATGAAIPHVLLETSRQDSWLTVLIAWAADAVLGLVIAYMGLRFPGETSVQYASSVLGRWLGKPVGLMYPLFFFLVAAIQVRSVVDLIGTLFLPGTPGGIIALASLATAGYAARHGLEVTARAAEVLGPIVIVSTVAIVIMVSPEVHLEQLQPVLENGPGPVLQSVPLTVSFLGVCIIMGMFQAYQENPRQAWHAKFAAVTGGAALLIGVLLLAVTVLGAHVALRANYPDMSVVRAISIADFLERMEALWVVISVGSNVLALGILLWASALGFAQTFGLREYKPLVLPLAGLMLPLSLMLFDDSSARVEFIRNIFPFYALLVEAGLAVVVWLSALLLGRRGIAGNRNVEG